MLIKIPLFVPSSETGIAVASMETRGAQKREVRTKIAQMVARNYSPTRVIIDLKGRSRGTWPSLCSLL